MILNPDPTKRFSIEDITEHPWYNQIEHQPPYTPSVVIGQDPIQVDDKILATLNKDYNLDPTKVVDEIQRNRFNDYTTTYYLLFKRKERAAIFRQQYNDEVKKLLKRKNPKQVSEPKEIKEIKEEVVQEKPRVENPTTTIQDEKVTQVAAPKNLAKAPLM